MRETLTSSSVVAHGAGSIPARPTGFGCRREGAGARKALSISGRSEPFDSDGGSREGLTRKGDRGAQDG